MSNLYSFKLEANKWVIKARWFYLSLVLFVCLALAWPKLLLVDWSNSNWLSEPLLFLFLIAFLGNLLLLVVSRIIDLETAHRHVPILSFLQIAFEVIIISLFIYDYQTNSQILSVLFFIPIVESIVLFGNQGPLIVSLLIGVILNILLFLVNVDWLGFLLRQQDVALLDKISATSIFTWSLIFSAIYLAVGSVSSYIAKQITLREKKLEEEMVNNQVQINALRNFNKELEKDTRELRAKDFELSRANQRLETLEEAKSKFVSVTAHQLRTPLSAIKWTFDMVLTGGLGPVNSEQKEFLSKGFDSTQRMIRIVNDLLHVDQMDTDKIDLKYEKVNLNSLLESVSFEFTNQATSKEIKFEVKAPVKALPEIEADQVKLRIVLENLIDNAIKYTPKGGAVTVTLSDAKLNTAQSMVEIIVSDSGIGIPESEKSKIFSKFFRATNAIRTEPDGSGIGLYISKDIIEKHGGSLWYESSPEKGSSFHLALPLRQRAV